MATQGQQAVETILKLTVDYDKGIKAVGSYLAEIKKLKDEQKDLNAAFSSGAITEKQYGDAMAANKTTVKQLETETKVLTTEIRKKLEADRAEQKQIDINTASYNQLSAQYKVMKQRINEMSAAEREQNKAYIQQSKAVYERMKSLQAETGKMQLNVGNYQAAITQAITGNSRFASSLMGMAGGATSMGGALGIVNANAMALGETFTMLLANPVFLAIAGIAGAGMAFKWFKDYNEGLAEASRLTTQFTGLTGEAMDGVRDSIQATADAFGKDFKETLQATDSLVAQFGISWGEAVNIINKGFEAGADINGDFLSNLQQYAPALRDAGLSAEELVAVLQQTRSGVFGKDGLDVIQKASRSLRDMTNSTAEALRGVGINADELKEKLANGSITMMQAIQQVSGALKTVSGNSQEAGAVISDVFGKRGVAAGQAQLKAIEDLNMSLDSLIESEGEYGETQKEIVETQTLINKYTAALFGSDGWDVLKKKAELYAKQALLAVLRGVVAIINKSIDLYNFSTKMFDIMAVTIANAAGTAWGALRTFFKLVGDGLSGLGNSFKGFGTIIEGVFTLDTDKIKAGWSTVTSALTGAWRTAAIDARKFGAATAQSWADGYRTVLDREGVGHIELPAVASGGGGNTSYSGSGSGSSAPDSGSPSKSGGSTSKGGSSSASTAASDKELREWQQIQAKMLKGYDDYTKAQVAASQRRYELLLATTKKGSEEELRIRKQQLDFQQEQELAAIDQSVADAQERAYLSQLVFEKYAQQRAQMEAQFLQQQNDQLTQAVTNEFASRIAQAYDDELEQERIKLEQAQFMRDNAYQREGESLEAFNARKLQLEADYQQQKAALTNKEIEVEQVKFEALESIAGGIGKVFQAMGESDEEFARLSKVLALAEIAINTGKAIAAGVAQAQSVPFPGNIAAIATTVATILANIATAISTVKSAKFAKGGLITGAGTGTSDSITAQVSNGESVMTASATALFSPLLSALNQLGGGVPIVQTGVQSQLGEDMLAAAIAKGYALAPAPVVSVKEINDVENRVKVIENLARS